MGTRVPALLPVDLTSFVGRRSELTCVGRMLQASRLLTLTGTGGVGKTRLAVRAAHQQQRRFRHGVVFVELAPVQEPELVAGVIAEALGLPESPSVSRTDTILDHIRDRDTLVVIDNCEHLHAAVGALAANLLRHAPRLRILATSRQRLGVPGEQVLPVEPLPLPPTGAPVRAEAVAAHPSMDLLVDRARSAVPGFRVTPDNEAALVRICHQLEGIPLAIELAAVRLKVLTPAQLSVRLANRLQILTEGPSTVPTRQQALRATLDGTYELCSEHERDLWQYGSVFSGGFTLASIEEVCRHDAALAANLLQPLAGLIDKSVVTRTEEGGNIRFRMLATIREYGLEQLRCADALEVVRGGFVQWAGRLVDDFEQNWFGPDADHWFRQLRLEQSNLRTALEICLDGPGTAGTALRVAGPWAYWIAFSLSEGRHWLHRALAQPAGEPGARARALVSCGYIAALQGDQPAARAMLDESVRLGQAADDGECLAFATHLCGLSWYFDGELDRARRLLSDAADRYRVHHVHDGWVVSLHIHTGLALLFDQDLAAAQEEFRQALDRCRRVGERWMASYALFGLAFVEHDRGCNGAARRLLTESLEAKRDIGDVLGAALALDLYAWVLAADDDAERAAAVLAGAARMWGTFGRELYGSHDWLERRAACETRCRELIGDRAYDAAYVHGSTLSREETLALALDAAASGERKPVPARECPTVLTKRERQVAALVAKGLSNRDIAAQLTLSTRTVEGHVQQVLTKLAFTSRSQIAAWLASRAAADDEALR